MKQIKASSTIYYAIFIAFIGLLILADSSRIRERGGDHNLRVAIFDPLAERGGGQGFTDSCADLFESTGCDVVIYSGSEVTVSLLKRVPRGLDVLILRVHSGVFEDTVWLFTAEEYDSSRHILEQLSGELHIARTTPSTDPLFAVGSKFVRNYMKGRLQDTLIVMMGCEGLHSIDLGQAFLDSGASAYVSWDTLVSLSHADAATMGLLEAMVIDGMSLEEAVEHCQSTVGTDKYYDSRLEYIPEDAGVFRLSLASSVPD